MFGNWLLNIGICLYLGYWLFRQMLCRERFKTVPYNIRGGKTMSRMTSREKVKKESAKEQGFKNYLHPRTASMEEFTLKTAVGVSPAMKKDNYIVSTLF